MSEVQPARTETTGLLASLTIDDVAAGDGPRIRTLLEWLRELDLRATFFLIPFSFANRAVLDEDVELVAALREAQDQGHEYLPHGYDHELFECGLPDLMCLDDDGMLARIARTLSREEFQIRHSHTRGMMGARINRSQKILEQAFGAKPVGFRSGYHEFCRELYFALENCGIQWSSSRTAVPAAWLRTITEEALEVVPWVGLLPYWVGSVLEIPHLADYGSHLAPEDVDARVELASQHLALCEESHAPFVAVAHYSGLSAAGDPHEWRDSGFRSYERVIALAREKYNAQFVTMSEIAARAMATPHYWPQRDEYRR